jgi:hypothetical protein
VVVALVLVATFALVGRAMMTNATGALTVRVHDGDGNTYVYSLGQDGDHVIASSLGTNTISIKGGSVRMSDADCPNQSCMQQQPISQPGPQIICLPHRLWVEVTSTGDDKAGSLDEGLVEWSVSSETHDSSNAKDAGGAGDILDDLDTIAR